MPRDFTKPYTDAELEEVKKKFRELPTYDKGTDSVKSSDFVLLAKAIGFGKTDEEIKLAQDFWAKHSGGIIKWDNFMDMAKAAHDMGEASQVMARIVDKDGDGFISSDEFDELFKCMKIHDERLRELSFSDFVTEADINQDGKVSIDECADWIRLNTKN